MISPVPAENQADRAAVIDAARTHGEAHRAPDGVGWTAMYVAPSPPTEIDVRKITLDALGAALGSRWQPAARLTTGYSGSREDVDTGYAFQLPDGPALYGCTVDGVLSQLHITHISHAAADTLHQLGSTFGLILCDLWRDELVDLADRSAIDAYCTDE